MPSANHVEIEESAGLETQELGSNLHPLLLELQGLTASRLSTLQGRGKTLFAEGEPARGAYVLKSGTASISISSSEGRVVILRLAKPGDVLGLNSALTNGSYDTTVKTLEPCRTHFVSRLDLVELMQRSDSGARAILNLLSNDLTELTERARLLLLPQSAGARLARLLLEWSKMRDGKTSSIARVFKHEELAQMICSSRETVTRLLASLSRQQIIRVSSDSIVIRDRAALESIARD